MADLSLWDILNIIATQYPDALPILQKPGVAKVYIDYINSKQGPNPWTDAQLAAQIRATQWYQSSPQAVRDWDVLRATDPATAGQKAELTKRMVDQAQTETGLRLNDTDAFAFFVNAVKYGWDQNEIKYRLLSSVNTRGGAGGELGKNASDIKGMANDYGVPLSDQAVMGYARHLAEGAIDMNGIQGYLKEQAKALFPSIASAIDRGVTVRQYFDPYLQLAQQEVGVNPQSISFTDPKWMAAINAVDPKTGQRIPMTPSEWLSKLRTDPTYGYDKTGNARQSATQLATALAQKFGNQ